MKRFSICGVLLFVFTGLLFAQSETAQSVETAKKAYAEARKTYEDATANLERVHLRAEKRDIVKEVGALTPDQEKAFWPIYDKYEAELVKLNDLRFNLIKDYADHYAQMTDEKAKELTAGMLNFLAKRQDLRKNYVEQIQKVLPAVTAARLFQVENQVDLLIDLEIASQVPLIEEP